MLFVISAVPLALLIYISILISGVRYNPLLIFNVWWLVWIIFSVCNFMNFYTVSNSVYFMSLIAVISFNLFYYSLSYRFGNNKLGEIKYKLYRPTLFLNFLYTIITIFLIYRMFNLIDHNILNYWKVRPTFWGNQIAGVNKSLFTSGAYSFIYSALTSVVALSLLFGIKDFIDNKRRIVFIFSFINLILFSVLSAGRNLLIMNLLIMIISFYRLGATGRMKKTIFFGLLIIITMSTVRSGGLEKLSSALISYFTGSFAYLQVMLDSENLSGNFLYGTGILSQVMSPFFNVLQIFGVIDMKPATQVGVLLNEMIRISQSSPYYDYYNALPSWIFFGYKDFGILGILIYPFFAAVIYSFVMSKLNFKLTGHAIIGAYVEVNLLWMLFKPVLFDFSTILSIFLMLGLLTRIKVRAR